MPQCAVNSCRNSHRRTRGFPIKYHRFPPIPEVRKLWVRACSRETLPNGEPSFNLQTARVCSLHFTKDSYERNMQQAGSPRRNRLRLGSLPTLYLEPTMQSLMQELSENLKLKMPLKVVRVKKECSNAGKSRASKDSKKASYNKVANKDVGGNAEPGTSTSTDSALSTSRDSLSRGDDNLDVDINTSNESRPSNSRSSGGPSTSRCSDSLPSTSRCSDSLPSTGRCSYSLPSTSRCSYSLPSTSRCSYSLPSTSRDRFEQDASRGEEIVSMKEKTSEEQECHRPSTSEEQPSKARQQRENQQSLSAENCNSQQEPKIQRQPAKKQPRDARLATRKQQPRKPKLCQSIPAEPKHCKETEIRTQLENMTKNQGVEALTYLGLWPNSCLNKMHKLMSDYKKTLKDAGKNSRKSPRTSSDNIPQSQQNGAALPEEASTSSIVDKQSHCSAETSSKSPTETGSRRKTKSTSNAIAKRKRKLASEEEESIGELPVFKKCCLADREKHIENLVGQKEGTSEEFARRAEELRLQIEDLDHLAHSKEKEWNNILSARKLKEEAYLRLKRMTEVANFMEHGNNLGPESVPLTNLWVESIASGSGETSKEKSIVKENLSEIASQDSANIKKHNIALQKTMKNNKEDDRKQGEASNTVTRKISEGRQGAKVPVQSIIDAYRSKNPEIVPRRGRRMRNSVNVSLTAGGAMVETGHNVDSRPSSTDSCKSNPNATDSNNSVSFKDVLIQFARMSQQSEPIKTPQNYPDVTLHPVPPSTTSQNTAPQQTASLLHGILTKAQTPKPATFSPTLAKLLTAPERERSSPTATAISTAAPTTSAAVAIATATAAGSIPQQSASTTQHLLQAYHGSTLGAISELLSSSKARSEITITPVVNPPAPQSHSNNVIHVEDVEEESAVIDDREGRYSAVVRDNREERDNPRCQGCQERAAQFVCAGCGNQWYCSRDCQVAAWDQHSDVCSG